MKNNKTQSFWVWLTAIAMLLAALMPTVSHALRVQSGVEALSPVCTSTGMKWFDASTGEIREQTAQNDSDSTTEHCVWCSIHPVALISQLNATPALFLKLAGTSLPVYRIVSRPLEWPPSSPRAPPSVA